MLDITGKSGGIMLFNTTIGKSGGAGPSESDDLEFDLEGHGISGRRLAGR